MASGQPAFAIGLASYIHTVPFAKVRPRPHSDPIGTN